MGLEEGKLTLGLKTDDLALSQIAHALFDKKLAAALEKTMNPQGSPDLGDLGLTGASWRPLGGLLRRSLADLGDS